MEVSGLGGEVPKMVMKGDTKPNRNIVVGQKVDPSKVERSRQLRRRMTKEERVLWQNLRGRRLNGLRFSRQQVIDGFIVDFYCHAAGIVVEADGGIHDAQAAADAERDRVLKARGLRILRIPNAAINRNLSGVLNQIAAECSNR